ncbi:MAG: hypothetical protein Q8K98_08185 [Bacteroidota bacterium]|nr:hypothetical protein [Bacteroidota bacterium]
MSTLEIQKNVKYINDYRNKPIEVIVPVKIFQELLQLKMTMEIFEQEDVQKSIKRAKREIRAGETRSFRSGQEAIEWLRR